MRAGGSERIGYCINPNVRELTSEELSYYEAVMGTEAKVPMHEIVFRDAEHFRAYIGWLKEDSEGRLVFDLGEGKEYEFRPMVAS
jgi:hypothetical protein